MVLEINTELPVFDNTGFLSVQGIYNNNNTPIEILESSIVTYTGAGDTFLKLFAGNTYLFNGLEVLNYITIKSVSGTSVDGAGFAPDVLGSSDPESGDKPEYGGVLHITEDCIVSFHGDFGNGNYYGDTTDNGEFNIKVTPLAEEVVLLHGSDEIRVHPVVPTALTTPVEQTVWTNIQNDFSVIHRAIDLPPNAHIPVRDISVSSEHVAVVVTSTSECSLYFDLDANEFQREMKMYASLSAGETKTFVLKRSHVLFGVETKGLSDLTITAFGITEEQYNGAILPPSSFPSIGTHAIKFFITEKTIDEAVVKNEIGDSGVAIAFEASTGKILMISRSQVTEFLGGINIQDIITNQVFVDKVNELADISFNVSISDSSENTVGNATVTQTAPTTFEVTVPPELVGTSYKIVLNKS